MPPLYIRSPYPAIAGIPPQSRLREMSCAIEFARHATARWKEKAVALGLDGSVEALQSTFVKADPEIPNNRSTKWNLFKRGILHRAAQYLVADGWRFVVVGGLCVNVERVLPHENFTRR